MTRHRLIFVGGLHRSGTSLVARALAAHADVSGFHGTGVPEDEGQHLQTVYPPASALGGPGRFGLSEDAHLTEDSPLVTEENRRRLFDEWARYWDLGKAHLLEKSPPNLVRTRFLQALFPDSSFVVVIRHPIPVTLATVKWAGERTPGRLLAHWLAAHETFAADRERLERVRLVRYEDFVRDPRASLADLYAFLGLEGEPVLPEPVAGSNEAYFERWRSLRRNPLMRVYLAAVCRKHEQRVRAFGYSLRG